MKMFFAATAIALAVSTCTGMIVELEVCAPEIAVLLTLAAGVLIPATLVFV